MWIPTELYDTRAELLLEAFGIKEDCCQIEKKGNFYRGYASDMLEIADGRVCLSRNGLRHFIPENLLVHEESLRPLSEDDEKRKQQLETLRACKDTYTAFFSVFDTVFFRQEYRLAQVVSGLEALQDKVLLSGAFGIDFTGDVISYHRQLAVLLHNPSIKGNIPMLAFYARCILGEQIDVETSERVAVVNRPSEMYTSVRFVIRTNGLSTEEYGIRMERYKRFFHFLSDWFIPYDCEFDYCIKDRTRRFVLGDNPLTLDYDTQLL